MSILYHRRSGKISIRDHHVRNRIKNAFGLSSIFADDGISQYYLCSNAYKLLFNIGTMVMQKIEKNVADMNLVSSLHGL